MPSESPIRIRSTSLASSARETRVVGGQHRQLAAGLFGLGQHRHGEGRGLSAPLLMATGAVFRRGRLAYRLHAVGSHRRRQVGRAGPCRGSKTRGGDFQQRRSANARSCQVRMRHAQAGFVDDRVAVEQQVEVERARAPAGFAGAIAGCAFDFEQPPEQVARGQPVSSIATALREIRLRGQAPGRRAVARARPASCVPGSASMRASAEAKASATSPRLPPRPTKARTSSRCPAADPLRAPTPTARAASVAASAVASAKSASSSASLRRAGLRLAPEGDVLGVFGAAAWRSTRKSNAARKRGCESMRWLRLRWRMRDCSSQISCIGSENRRGSAIRVDLVQVTRSAARRSASAACTPCPATAPVRGNRPATAAARTGTPATPARRAPRAHRY